MIKGYSKAKIFRLSGVAFLLGIIFGYFFSYIILLLIILSLLIFLRKRVPFIVLFVIIFSFTVGFLRYNWVLNKIQFKIDKEKLIGFPLKVILSEEFDTYQKIIVIPKGIKNFSGGVIYTDLRPIYLKGEIIQLKKDQIEKLDTPYYTNGLFIYFKIKYPEIIKISSNNFVVYISVLKNKIKNIFNLYLKKPQADLLSSLVFGRKGNLDKEIEEKLNLSGLSHLVAVSGLHLVILTQIIINFLNQFSLNRFTRSIILIFLLLFFALLTGFTPSINRALSMAFLLILAELNFRLYHPLNALIFTALIMTFLNPFILIYDLGFQLSFLATLGIITFLPIFNQMAVFDHSPSLIFLKNFKEAFFTSLAALITVYPWLIFKIGQISTLALLSNTLVVPFVPYVLILALGLIVLNFLYLSSLVLGWILNLFLTYVLIVLRVFSSFKIFIISFPYSIRAFFLLFYILLIFYYFKYKREKLFLNSKL